MKILNAQDIEVKYQAENGEITALHNVSFSVEKGEFVSIVGPSGCGKSTLLSVIAGLIQPTKGSVEVCGEKVTGISEHIGYMLQNDNLLEWRTIWQNVLLGLEIQNKLTPQSKARAKKLLESYGLAGFEQKYPSQLSGGMRQRVALIRTLAVDPEILLLDEAFSALDFQTRLEVTDDVYSILKNENKTMLMVTHDISEAISMGDRIMLLSQRPASIKEILNVDFGTDKRIPTECRTTAGFTEYFDYIWKELKSYG